MLVVEPSHFGWHVCLLLSLSVSLSLSLSQHGKKSCFTITLWLACVFVVEPIPTRAVFESLLAHSAIHRTQDAICIPRVDSARYELERIFNDFPRTFGWHETTIQHWTSWFEELCLYGLNISALQWSWFYCFKQQCLIDNATLLHAEFVYTQLRCHQRVWW